MSDPTPPPPPQPVPLVGLPGAQLGDARVDAAGRDRVGLSGDEVGRLLEGQQEFSMTMVAAYEKMYRDLLQQIRAVSSHVELQFEIDASKRQKRQRALDVWLAALTATTAVMALGWIYLLWRLWPTLTAATLAVFAP